MSFRLTLLGHLDIIGEDGQSVVASLQRRPRAILVMLGAVAPSPLSRDRIVSLLWPESDEERARNSLRQALFQLRLKLGTDVVAGTAELRLDLRRCSCDVREFVEAARAGDPEVASALYRGALLEGTHLRSSVDFEQWVDVERARLARLFTECLRGAAASATARDDYDRAATLYERLLSHDPLDGRLALHAARAFMRAGSPGGALAAIQRHERALAIDLGVGVDAGLLAFRDELQRATPEVVVRTEPLSETTNASASSPPDASSVATAPRKTARGRIRISAVAAATLIAMATLVAERRPNQSGAAADTVIPVVLLSFDVRGDTADAYLRDGAPRLIATTLAAVGSVRPIVHGDAPAAPDTGLFVRGAVISSGERVRVDAELRSRRDPARALAIASEDGPRSQLLSVVARASADLVVPFLGAEASERIRDAAVGTSSEAALREFLRGEAAFRAARFPDAAAAYRAATVRDSNFALAWYRLAIALDWSASYTDLVRESARRARDTDKSLPPRIRWIIDAHYAWRIGNPANAERLYRQVLDQRPDDPEALSMLGELYFHDNPLRGAPIDAARPLFERLLAIDPGNRDALTHLQRLALARRDWVAADVLERRIGALVGTAAPNEATVFRIMTRGTPAQFDSLRAISRVRATGWAEYVAERSAIYGGAWDRAAVLTRPIADPQHAATDRAIALRMLIEMAAAHGRLAESDSLVRLLLQLSPADGLWTLAELAMLPLRPDSEPAMREAAVMLRAWHPRNGDTLAVQRGLLRGYLIAELERRLGNPRVGIQAIHDLASRSSNPDETDGPAAYQHALEVALASDSGHVHDAPAAGSQLQGIQVLRERERWDAAEGYRAAGRFADAEQWFDSFELLYYEDSMYAAEGHLERARLFSRERKFSDAQRELARVGEYWQHADPILRSILAQETRRLEEAHR